jgi:predicted Rossmann fold nucleotide-binding protein DprA/Smf involved in DNA uptake
MQLMLKLCAFLLALPSITNGTNKSLLQLLTNIQPDRNQINNDLPNLNQIKLNLQKMDDEHQIKLDEDQAEALEQAKENEEETEVINNLIATISYSNY